MKRVLRAAMVAVSALVCIGLIQPVEAAQKAAKQKAQDDMAKVVIQVSDNDPAKWALALNNAKNVQEDLGKDKVKIEIVAYGPGLGMVKLDSAVAPRVAEAVADGVAVVACENTMRKQKLSQADMLPNLGYAKAGVVELMQKQKEGYAYIRP
ncbi:MAG: DsrE family protein [Betaproteobacteria bacterium]|nr:DsrE family protein [Betaproteobacteria bacterium]